MRSIDVLMVLWDYPPPHNEIYCIYCGSVNIDISYKDRDCYIKIQ